MSFISNALQQLRPVERDLAQDALKVALTPVMAPLALLNAREAIDPTRQSDARRVFAATACDPSRVFGTEATSSNVRRGLSREGDPVKELAEEATDAATNNILGQSVRLAGSGLAIAGAVVDDATKNSDKLKGLGNKLGVAGAVIGFAHFAKDPSLNSGARALAGAAGIAGIFAKSGGVKALLGKLGTAATVGFSLVDTFKALKAGDEGKAATAALPAVGAGVGAAVGALGFGVGAVPGAAIGAAVGSFASAGINLAGELF